MSTDAPDYQHVVVLAPAGPVTDAPDWQDVVAGPGGTPIGGGYASLTGAGQTATPGDLTQQGGLAVDVPAGSLTGFGVTNLDPSTPITLDDLAAAGVTIHTSGAGEIFIVSSSGTGGIVLQTGPAASILFNTDSMGFFSGPVGPQPTITGSRGGNVALAALLTGLAAMGLIIDSSTP